jgi:acyl-CoA thioester hydrolase
MAFSHRIRVRYSECDPQGVVFNANYLGYFDIAITEVWRDCLGGYQELLETGVDSVVAEATVRYLVPVKYDDLIDLEVSVAKIGNTSLITEHRITREGVVCAEGSVRYVFINAASGRPTPIPDSVRAALATV